MKKEIEVSARTKEEAIAQAVAELGAPSESALVITVVREARKGFLGFGAVDAVIHAAYQVLFTKNVSKVLLLIWKNMRKISRRIRSSSLCRWVESHTPTRRKRELQS